jgi:hypothetical protein
MNKSELTKLVNTIQDLGKQHRDLERLIEQQSDCLDDDSYNELIERHNNLIFKKTTAINNFNKISGRNVRLGIFKQLS